MDTRNGNIVDYGEVEAMRGRKDVTANFFKKIPDKYLSLLQGMNRKQRRDWYKKNKNLMK